MTTPQHARVTGLYRYPVKGFTAEAMQTVDLQEGETFPFDRVYAIANGDIPFDPDAPGYLKKIHFLMLMKNGGLARLQADFNEADHRLSLSENDRVLTSGSLLTANGRSAIEQFLTVRFSSEMRGHFKVVSAPDHAFTDVPDKWVSLINLESLRDLEAKLGVAVDPLRFRANIYVDGIPAWSELEMVGQDLVAPGVEFLVEASTDRCAATEVDPVTGERDIKMVRRLNELYGHINCGVYLNVQKSGCLSLGDHLLLARANSGEVEAL